MHIPEICLTASSLVCVSFSHSSDGLINALNQHNTLHEQPTCFNYRCPHYRNIVHAWRYDETLRFRVWCDEHASGIQMCDTGVLSPVMIVRHRARQIARFLNGPKSQDFSSKMSLLLNICYLRLAMFHLAVMLPRVHIGGRTPRASVGLMLHCLNSGDFLGAARFDNPFYDGCSGQLSALPSPQLVRHFSVVDIIRSRCESLWQSTLPQLQDESWIIGMLIAITLNVPYKR